MVVIVFGSLESERGELKTKLKETTKKVFIESISRASPASQVSAPAGGGGGGAGPASIGPYVPAPIKVRVSLFPGKFRLFRKLQVCLLQKLKCFCQRWLKNTLKFLGSDS